MTLPIRRVGCTAACLAKHAALDCTQASRCRLRACHVRAPFDSARLNAGMMLPGSRIDRLPTHVQRAAGPAAGRRGLSPAAGAAPSKPTWPFQYTHPLAAQQPTAAQHHPAHPCFAHLLLVLLRLFGCCARHLCCFVSLDVLLLGWQALRRELQLEGKW